MQSLVQNESLGALLIKKLKTARAEHETKLEPF